MHNPGENFSQSNIPNDNPWENMSADSPETVSDEGLTSSTEDTIEQAPQPEISQETVANKAKQNKNLKKIIIPAAAGAIVLALAVGGIFHHVIDKKPENTQPDQNTDLAEYEKAQLEITRDGYDAKGMWLSKNKNWEYNFACANEVRQVCNNDDIEMVKYTAEHQSESFADYLAGLPQELQLDGLKNMNILDTEKALDQLSDDDYKKAVEDFGNVMDRAQVRDTVLYGSYDNAFMQLKDKDATADYQNMKLVKCVTTENGTMAKEYYWVNKDGREIGSMIIKAGLDGCMQLVTRAGSSHIYEGMPEIPQPTPQPTPEPETIKAKDAENLIRIDREINQDIAHDIGSEQVVVTPTGSVSNADITERPSSSDYRPIDSSNSAPGDAAAQNAANAAAEEMINSGNIPKSAEDVPDDIWASFGY